MDKKARITIIIASISFTISLLLLIIGVFDTFELKAYDLLSRSFNPSRSDENIVIVEIDQHSVDALSDLGINWPWPRQIYAPIVTYLSEADAVFIDMLYTEPSSYGIEDDAIFAEAIKDASNVYLPLFLTDRDKVMSDSDNDFLAKHASIGDINVHSKYNSVVTPIDVLKASARGTGNVMIKPDMDGVYRRIPLFFGIKQYKIPNLVLDYLFKQKKADIRNGQLYIDNIRIPLKDNQLFLKFYRGTEPFPVYSVAVVLESYQALQEGRTPQIKEDFFKGKKVLIGPTAAGLFDLKPTAVSSVSTGVMVHATTLDNLIHDKFIQQVKIGFVILLMIILSFIICHIVIRNISIYINLFYFLSILIIVSVTDALLFVSGYYIITIAPFSSVVVGFLASTAYSYATEGKERRFIKNTFSQYMDSKIVNYILENPDLIKPGGQRRRVTVFFTDIAGFTTMAEKLPAEKTAKILHTTLNAFSEVIISNGGVIDKYIGDAIMAFWGAPLSTDNDELNACTAALLCSRSLDMINNSFDAEGLQEINMRIGLNTGEAIVGNLGSDRLFDYTAIGDTVNLASRLEGVNKVFRTRIIVSEDTLISIKDTFLARGLGRIEVKGKGLPVQIYELLAEQSDATADQKALAIAFQRGRAFFMNQDWDNAMTAFDVVLKILPGDGPAEYYRKWCSELSRQSELTEGWDIIKMTVK